ncbi:kinase-like domain-containing protein [Blyttiomyces helicus]|uniref:Kinase-like domain-containing protein n=1 Tax=Blyttiomyces helicus TaxID=388810 RepID=A0A4P9VYU6_9FUNG|nr:kinase-like domain-containing protein [Blyttiomyces helicus]|eukprot:RKO84971.1 kinase-like domain-containing protein [Blyttiomyces helicus]
MQPHNFLTESSVRAYLSNPSTLASHPPTDKITAISPLSGGLCNNVWRITFSSSKPLILKQFPAFLRTIPSFSLPTQRAQVEFGALTRMQPASEGAVGWATPRPIAYDAEASVVVMEDAGAELVTFFDALKRGRDDPLKTDWVVAALAEFVACVSDVRGSIAPTALMTGVLTALGEEVGSAWFARSTAARAMEPGWIFGDLWPASVLIDSERRRVTVVDWECCRPGHSGVDVTQMAGNLFLMTLGAPFRNEVAERCLRGFVRAAMDSRAHDAGFDYAGAFVGHVADLVKYPHWELPDINAAVVQSVRLAKNLFLL